MKKIKLPNKEIGKLFKFLEDNQIDEYTHNIKRVEDISQKGGYNYSLKIKKDKTTFWSWFGTLMVGLYFAIKIVEGWETIAQIANLDDWVVLFLIFGLIGILICSYFFFKVIVETFIYKNKFVIVDEDKTKKTHYISNLEPEKW